MSKPLSSLDTKMGELPSLRAMQSPVLKRFSTEDTFCHSRSKRLSPRNMSSGYHWLCLLCSINRAIQSLVRPRNDLDPFTSIYMNMFLGPLHLCIAHSEHSYIPFIFLFNLLSSILAQAARDRPPSAAWRFCLLLRPRFFPRLCLPKGGRILWGPCLSL